MKRILLFLSLLILPVLVWALPDNVQPVEVTGSQQVKTTSGVVYSVNANYKGVTAGDKIELIDTAAGPTGTTRSNCTASGANGNCAIAFTAGAIFNSGIYYKETKTGGTFTTDLQYF